jgi:hypothetical protein
MSCPDKNILVKCSFETIEHFMAKACLFFQLCGLKHDIRTEFRVPNGYADIVDMTTHTIYEIELGYGKKYRNRKIALYQMPGFDVIVVDCHRLPSNLKDMAVFLEQYIVPD